MDIYINPVSDIHLPNKPSFTDRDCNLDSPGSTIGYCRCT